MGRAQRIHFSQGVYLVEQKRLQPPLFQTDEDYVRFCAQLSALTRRTHVRLHAFCFLPTGFYFIAQVDEIPLSRFMLLLMRQCADLFGRGEESIPHPRYRTLLINPRQYLLPLVRYLHWLPELEHFGEMQTYPWSSHLPYLHQTTLTWLTTVSVRRALGGRCRDFVAAYQSLMAQRPTAAEIHDFQHGSRSDVRRLSHAVPLQPLKPSDKTALDIIFDFFLELYEVNEVELISRSKRKRIPEARALIAWFAREFGYATLRESCARLRRAPSTLSQSIAFHRMLEPKLFSRRAWFVDALIQRLHYSNQRPQPATRTRPTIS